MQINKRWAALCADLELNLGLTPDVLGVEGVNLITWFQVHNLLLVLPSLVRFEALLVISLSICVTVVCLLLDHQFHCAVYDL